MRRVGGVYERVGGIWEGGRGFVRGRARRGAVVRGRVGFVKPGTHHAIFVFCWTKRRLSHGVCASKTIVVR